MSLEEDVMEAVEFDTDAIIDALDEHFEPEDVDELSDLYNEFKEELQVGITSTVKNMESRWHYYNYDNENYNE